MTIIFTGLEPVYDYTPADSLSILGTDDADQITAVDGPQYNGADTIYVSEANGNFENVTFANKGELGIFGMGGDDTIDVSGVSSTNTALPANGIAIYGGDGDDVLRGLTNGTINEVLSGDGGNDQIYSVAASGSAAFVTYMNGGDGDDQLYSGPANDLMVGGAGSDTYFFDTNGFLGSDEIGEVNNDLSATDVDTIDVSANTDVTWVTLSYTDWQSINPSNLALKLTDPNGIENFIGGSGGGSILGNSRDNTITVTGSAVYGIDGYDGNDTITGGDGADYLVGGNGDDTIDGGAGNDAIYGEAGNNYLAGGDGNDYLKGGDDGNYLTGDAGDDILDGGAGDDQLIGGDGNDTLVGEAGNDYLDGGAGNDGLYGRDGDDTLIGGAGDDYLTGEAGSDTFGFDPSVLPTATSGAIPLSKPPTPTATRSISAR